MLEQCHFIDLPKITDTRGNLTFVESERHIPFALKRIYYLYDVPAGEMRAGHGHKQLQQVFIALSGSFDLHLDDGTHKKTIHLNRPFSGFYVSSMIWRVVDNFSSGSVCMVLASENYDEADYFRNYDDFLNAAKQGIS